MTKSFVNSQKAGPQQQVDDSQGAPASPSGPGAETNVLALINSAYLKEAAKEDRELVQSWTETVNIILTFGGLLSAVITAFLLTVQPDLELEPIESTNHILLRILHQLDNTTNLPLDPRQTFAPSAPTIRVLIAWHTSLGCSLTSTFGALLSKLWVLHYQSNPRWADAEMDQSRLREARFDSLERWKMHAIIESLPVILQFAVFLFYLGLAESLRPTKVLYSITISFAALMGTLFVVTLLTGTLFPSCPYKSSLSSFISKSVGAAFFWSWGASKTAVGLFYWRLGMLYEEGFTQLSKERYNEIIADIKKYWNTRMARRKIDGFEYGLGERSIVDEESYSPGVLCWWLQAPRMWKKLDKQGLDSVVDAIMKSHVGSVMETERWKRNFEIWSLRVFRRLRLPSPAKRHQLQADMVCYFIHHSSEAGESVRLAIDKSKHHLLTFESTNVYICKAIRHSFASGERIWSKPLPVATMRRTTLSVYLRYQLLDWAEHETQWNRDLLLQELPTALDSDCFQDLNIHLTSLVDAISLAAIALVPSDSHPEVHPAWSIANSDITEQLLQAIHRLSYFPSDTPILSTQHGIIQEEDEVVRKKEIESQRKLVGLVVSGAGRVLGKILGGPQKEHLYGSSSWEDGSFADSLSRLMHIGHMWWHAEPCTGYPRPPGANLVRELHALILRFPRGQPNDNFLVGMRGKASVQHINNEENQQETVILSPDFAVQTLTSYAHPYGTNDVSDPHSQRASNALDYVLGLRFYRMTSHLLTSFLPGHLLDINLSRSPAPPLGFTPPAYLTRQLIYNINNNATNHDLRRLSLSIIVKSQDIFTSQGNSLSLPLENALKSLLDDMIHSQNILETLSVQAYNHFTLWGELTAALEHRERWENGSPPPSLSEK